MTRVSLFTALLVVASSCAGGSSSQHAKLATISYDVPADWTNQDTKLRGVATSVWTPADGNARKESVTVIRSERSPAVAGAGTATLASLVTEAQAPGAQVSAAQPFTTESGLRGVRVEAAFVPAGLSQRYQRIHVVLVDGSALIHVMYTAQTPDASLDALDTVLNSIRHEEG